MATCSSKQNAQQIEEAGKLIVSRLHEARRKKGHLICPVCRTSFDGTHVIKCPGCRTLISNAFQEIRKSKPTRKPAPRKNPRTINNVQVSRNPKTPKNFGGSKNPGMSEKLQLDFFI